MITISEHRLSELFASFERTTLAVVGDVMLDRYIWGNVDRISPEAPVPIVEVESESARLGGAANVAQNIRSLGGTALLSGVVGDDANSRSFVELMQEAGFSTDGIFHDNTRPTTVKTRIIALHQHVVRVDRESRKELSEDLEKRILNFLRDHISGLHAIILQDYNKGIFTQNLIRQIVALANQHKKIITVDPKFTNFFAYEGVTVFKPNKLEVEKALAVKLESRADVERACQELRSRLRAQNLLMTQGERGMTLCEDDDSIMHLPAQARKVADVSGAGDTVISTMTMALAGGAHPREASTLANFAGGVVCGEVGVVPIDRDALREAVLAATDHQTTTAGTP